MPLLFNSVQLGSCAARVRSSMRNPCETQVKSFGVSSAKLRVALSSDMARRSGVDSANRKPAEAADPPRITRQAPVISDVQKLAILGIACVFGVFFGTRTSSYLSSRQLAQSNTAIREQALAEHRAALETLDAQERAISSGSSSINDTSGLPPKWQLVIEKVVLVPAFLNEAHIKEASDQPSCVASGRTHTLYTHQIWLSASGLPRDQQQQVRSAIRFLSTFLHCPCEATLYVLTAPDLA